ncbi:hypothetical protein SNEBB_003414 [Seison nebaliae]|nr:hypothetical protein SNEBB_003414 [Seison nebaliae]
MNYNENISSDSISNIETISVKRLNSLNEIDERKKEKKNNHAKKISFTTIVILILASSTIILSIVIIATSASGVLRSKEKTVNTTTTTTTTTSTTTSEVIRTVEVKTVIKLIIFDLPTKLISANSCRNISKLLIESIRQIFHTNLIFSSVQCDLKEKDVPYSIHSVIRTYYRLRAYLNDKESDQDKVSTKNMLIGHFSQISSNLTHQLSLIKLNLTISMINQK